MGKITVLSHYSIEINYIGEDRSDYNYKILCYHDNN